MICLFLLTHMLGNTERKPRYELGMNESFETEIYAKHEGKALKIGHFTYCCYFIIISILMKLDFAA